jgi:hypothetical protein
MTTPPMSLDHPVLGCARAMGAALDEVASADPVLMGVAAKEAALVELSAIVDRTQELLVRVLAHADDVAAEHGARSPAAWLSHETRCGYAPAVGAARLGEALDARWSRLRRALAAGALHTEQARVIARALDELPADLDPDVAARAEAHLLAQAAHFDPSRLRVLGRKVLEVVAPDLADDLERRRLEAEEARARRTTELVMRRRGDGTTDLRIRVADAVAARLRTYLEAYASPRRGHLDPTRDHVDPESGRRVPYAVLMGHAFCAMLEAIEVRRLPRHAGSPTSLVVTITLDQLREQTGAARLASGESISVTEAMRLACTAQIIPVVLGGQGQPLHLGRARRLFSDAMRVAMGVRDGHCRAHGCDIPAAWCEAHHLHPWARGGQTDLEDGLLLCPYHHHRAHDPTYHTDRMPNGDLRYHRRT